MQSSEKTDSRTGKEKKVVVPVWFTCKVPKAEKVYVAGDFTEWGAAPQPLKQVREGMWEARISLTPGSHQYKFIVDGEWLNDPSCNKTAPDGFGAVNSVIDVK